MIVTDALTKGGTVETGKALVIAENPRERRALVDMAEAAMNGTKLRRNSAAWKAAKQFYDDLGY